MNCLNLSDNNIKSLVDKYSEITVSKAQDEWERLGNKDFPSDKFIDDFNKLQNKSNIPNHVYSPDVRLDINRTLSYFVLNELNANDSLLIGYIANKGKDLKTLCANTLEDMIKDDQIDNSKKQLVQNIIDNIKTDKNDIWNNFKKYLEYNFGLKTTNAYDQFISQGELGEVREDWDGHKIFNDPKETISTKIKLAFANILDPTQISTIGATGIIDVDDIYNKLLHYHQSDDNIKQVIGTLNRLSEDISPIYGDIANILNDSINRDDKLKNDFANAYLQATKQNIQKDKILAINSRDENKLKVDVIVNNRDSFPELALYDKIKDQILSKIEKGFYKSDSVIFTKNDKLTDLQNISNALKELNIPISYTYLKNIQFTSDFVNLTKQLEYLGKSLKANIIKYDVNKATQFNAKGDLLKIIKLVKPGLELTPEYGYQNVSGKVQQSAQQVCHVTNMFKQFNPTDIENIMRRYEHFTKTPQLIHSNWLWKQFPGDENGIFKPIFDKNKPKLFGYDNKGNETTENPIYFNYKIDTEAESKDGSKGIDISYLNQFDIARYGGQKNITHSEGKEYTDLIGYSWDLNTIANYIIGNPTEEQTIGRYNMMLPSSDASGTYGIMSPKHLVDVQLERNSINDKYNIKLSDHTFDKIRNTIHQELEEMIVARDIIFDQNEFRKANFVKGANIDENSLHSVKHGNYDKNKNTFTIIKDNRPTGKVFDPSNITYTENGKLITLKSYLKDNYSLDLPLFTRNDIKKNQQYIDNFITDAFDNKINQFLKYSEPLQSTLFLLRDKNGNDIIKGDNKRDKLNHILSEFYIDNYLNYVEMGNLIYGNASEYKGVLDWNKRVNQAIRPGLQHFSNRNTKQITCNDVYLDSKIPELMKGILSPNILEQYNKKVNTADGFSVITLDEYKQRLLEAGRYQEYSKLIDKLEYGQQFNAKDYNIFIESQKYFSYSRQMMKDFPTLSSYQFKNSTMVLVPNFIQGTEWEDVHNFMKQVGADQLNFDSSTKLGGVHTFNISDKNGNFKLPNVDDVKSMITEHPVSSLYIQQDIPSHLVDSDNKAGVQLMKIIITNLDYTDNKRYNINGELKTGKELNNLWHEINGANISDSANSLLHELDAIDSEGQIRTDNNGNILVNKSKILEYIRDYVGTSTDNSNMLTGLEGDLYDSNIPFFASVNTSKFTQIILSKFTKDIVDQELPGMSLVLVPDIFIKPSSRYKNIEDYFNESKYSYTNEFRERCIKENKFELKPITDYNEQGNAINGYEAIINPFSSEFKSENGKVDINQLSDDARNMIGIRIPTEGKQSIVFIKVVGFMNSGSSQIILPYDLINTTGWDFDADKLFVYHKHLENNNGIFSPIDNSKHSNEDKYIKYIKDKTSNIKYNDIINKNQSKRSSIVDYINNSGIITSSSDTELGLSNKFKDSIDSYIKENSGFLINGTNIDLKSIKTLYDLIFALKKAIDTKQSLGEKNLTIKADINNYNEKLKELVNLFSDEPIELNNFNIAKSIAKIHDIENFDTFNKRKDVAKYDRGTKDNHIIEMMKSVMRNKYHANEAFKQNDSSHLESSSNYVNNIAGFKVDQFNQNDYTENSKLRKLNVQTRNLKGISVATDGLLNILSTINANFDGRMVPELKVHESHIPLSQSELSEIFGENLTKEGDYYYIRDQYIGNNASGTWKDTSGQPHSSQMSEVTTNILDAVKKLMFFNFDKNTIGIFKTMALGSLVHKDNITNSENDFNRYVYPVLFLSQPIISDYNRTINLAVTYDSKESVINNKVTGAYYRKFYDSIWNKEIEARLPLSTTINKKDKTIIAEWSETKKINGSYLINEILNKFISQDNKSKLLSQISSGKDIELYGKNSYHSDLYNYLKQALLINNNYQTLEDLNSNFKNYYKNNEKLVTPQDISNQIEVFNTFKKYSTLSKAITKAVNTLNVDKQSIGPTTIKSKKLFNNISNSTFSPQELRDELYNIKRDLESIDINALTPNLIKNYIRKYTIETDNNKKRNVLTEINQFLSKYNQELGDPSTTIKVKGKSIFQSIYPSQFGLDKQSSYPILEDYLNNGHWIASNVLSGISLFETNNAKELKNLVFDELYGQDMEYIDKEINHSILRSHANNLTYFKNSEPEIPRIFGITKSDVDLKSININDITNLDSNLSKFEQLSLGDKITLLMSDSKMQDYIRDPKFKNSHILDSISIKNTKEQIKKYGYETIEYTNNDSNQNMQIFSMSDMYYSTNPYLNSIADDLIKYSFFKDGFKYGNNIAKIIPSDLYYHTKEEIDYINNISNRISNGEEIPENELERYSRLQYNSPKNYADLMRNKLDEDNTDIRDDLNQEKILNQIKAFHQQNKFNKTINPLVKTNSRSDKPKFKLYSIDKSEIIKDAESKKYDIFVENAELVDKSYYNRNNFITYNDNGKIRLFTRIQDAIDQANRKTDVYVYYPINGTLSGEYLKTNVSAFQEHSEEEYLNFIQQLKKSNKLNSIYTGAFDKNIDFASRLQELYNMDSEYLHSILPHLNFEEDENGVTKDIDDIVGNYRPQIEKILEILDNYHANHTADSITIEDRFKDGEFKNPNKKLMFEFAKAEDKNIYIKDRDLSDMQGNTNVIYHYDKNTNTISEYDNTSPISNKIEDILYYVANKYNTAGELGLTKDGRISRGRADSLINLINYIDDKRGNKTIVEYINDNNDNLRKAFPGISIVIDKIPELAKTEFFNDINKYIEKGQSSLTSIKYSELFTTISKKATNSDTANALNILSDYTLNIGNTNHLEYNAIEDKDKVLLIDYKKPISENIKLIKDKINSFKNDNITLGLIGETEGKSQEFYNEYVNKLLSNIDKQIKIVTLDKPGVYQTTLNDSKYDTLILNNKNKFQERHNDNAKYSNLFESELLTEDEKLDLKDTNEIFNRQNTINNLKEGALNILRLKNGTYNLQSKAGGELNEIITIAGNKLLTSNVIDKLAKGDDAKSSEIASEQLVITAIKSKSYIRELNTKLNDINLNTLFNTENNELRSSIAVDIRTAGDLKKSLDYINNLVEIGVDQNDDNVKSYNRVNQNIDALRTQREEFLNEWNKTSTFFNKFIAQNIYERTKNPHYEDSKYNEIKKQFHTELEGKEYTPENLSNTGLAHIMRDMFSTGEDIGFFTKYFDSPFNTGVTPIDTMLLEYFDQHEQLLNKRKGYSNELVKLYDDYNGNGLEMIKSSSFDKRVNNAKRFLDDNNEYISDTKWSEFKKNYYENTQKVYELQREYDKLNKENNKGRAQIVQKIKNQWEWLANNVEGINIDKEGDNIKGIKIDPSIKINNKQADELNAKKDFYSQNSRFNRYLMANRIHKLNTKYVKLHDAEYINLIPKKDKYTNNIYNNLNDKEKAFVDGLRNLTNKISNENINEYTIDNNFFPKILAPSAKGTLRQIAGINHITPEEKFTKTGVNNEVRYIIDAPHIKDFEFYHEFNVPNKLSNETPQEYQERALKAINNWYKTTKLEKQEFIKEKIGENGFTKLDDVYAYNRYVREYNAQRTSQEVIKDPYIALSTYAAGLTNYRFSNDFYSYNLALIDALSENLKLTSSKGLQDYVKSKISGKRENKVIPFDESNIYEKLQSLNKNIMNTPLVNTRLEQVYNALYRYTSTTYMAFGVMNGFKNLLFGYNMNLTEGAAGQFIGQKELAKATADYIKAVPTILSETGMEHSQSLDVALMKSAPTVWEDTSEQEHLRSFPNLAGKIKWAYDAAFFCNNAAYHFMQYSMFLGCTESHRVYNGKIFSKHDFIDGNTRTAIESVLTPEEKQSLSKFIENKTKLQKHEIEEHSYVTDWIQIHESELKDRHKQIINKIKELNKTVEAKFNELPTVKSQFELKNGRAEFIENSLIDSNEYARFKRRVQLINQYLQGTYNRIDKNIVRQTALGMGLMQFRQWMYPNVMRYYSKPIFNEGLGVYQKGAYSTLFHLLWTPIRNAKYTNDEGEHIKKGVANVMLDYLRYFQSLKFHYATMDENSKAKVKIAVSNFIQIAGFTLGTAALLALSGKDDKEQRESIRNSRALATLLYFSYSTGSELDQMLPTQLFSTLRKTQQNINATESTVGDLIKLIKTGVTYPFDSEDEREYTRGVYKGEDKLKIDFEKVFPVARQINKIEYVQQYMDWYKQYALKWY